MGELFVIFCSLIFATQILVVARISSVDGCIQTQSQSRMFVMKEEHSKTPCGIFPIPAVHYRCHVVRSTLGLRYKVTIP